MKKIEFVLNGKLHSITKKETNNILQIFWGTLPTPRLMAEGNDEDELKNNVLEFAFEHRSEILSERVVGYSEGFDFEEVLNGETLYDAQFARYVEEHSAWDIAFDIVDGDIGFVDWTEVNECL